MKKAHGVSAVDQENEDRKLRKDIVENHQSETDHYQELPANIQKKLDWFQDQKLGVIFHWGLYSIPGIVESWQLSQEDSWARKIPWRTNMVELREDYWGLIHSFNPYKFEPTKWAKLCRQAGFRYMIFTTKHHDGFTMYDTKYSDYKVTAATCPYHKAPQADIFKAVVTAFRKEGLATGAYYSKPDWHSPYYWLPEREATGRYANYDPKELPEIWQKYDRFVTNQLIEISQNYGQLDILWLDGGWVNQGNEQLDMEKIASEVRHSQPDLLIVDRTIGGAYENYVTPERKIPEQPPVKVWESNIPLTKNWGYWPNDEYKEVAEVILSFVQIVAKGGNLLLGIGPKPNGELPTEAVAILERLGDWLEKYGEGIYETRAVPFDSPEGWYVTQKNDDYYFFYKENASSLLLSEVGLDYRNFTIQELSEKNQVMGSETLVPGKTIEGIGCWQLMAEKEWMLLDE